MLLPKYVREKLPNAKIGFFLHIPFPSFELFRLLPWRKEIVDGLLGADLIGFHTYDYVRHFIESIQSMLKYECSHGQIYSENRIVKADAFPMGIDYERFEKEVRSARAKRHAKKLRKKLGEQKVILSVDRLDYTKGISQRLESFDLFLEKNPRYKGKVTLILLASPSRTSVKYYRLLKREVDEIVGRINGSHGTMGWVPIWYLHRSIPFCNLVALYDVADVALITPLRDGMNLIAKEFLATKKDGKGVLILSGMAGAAKELVEAIIINPNNVEAIAEAINEALEMPIDEQKTRNRIMQKRLRHYNVSRWVNDFMDNLFSIKKFKMNSFQ
jgi:trehalose 6-phosphate synthase/phosphatase